MASMQAPGWLARPIRAIEHARWLDAPTGRLEPLTGRLAAGTRGAVLRGEWLGHALHPLLTDFPMGCWASAGLLDLFGGRRSRVASRRLVGMGLAFVPATAATGWVEWSAADDERVKRVGVVHAAGNTAVAALYFSSWRARRRGEHLRGVAAGMAGGLLAWATGYLGGHMSFARGAGVGERGLGQPGATEPAGVPDEGLVDVGSAAALLGVDHEQVMGLVEADLLVPRRGRGSDAQFRRADVLAARMVGA